MALTDQRPDSGTARVCAIIPAHNEEANIVETVRDLRTHHPEITVIVVDDASTDHTPTAARIPRITLLSLPINLGIGGAVQTGLKYALNRQFDVAIQFDGDGQHMAMEIARLIAPIITGQADVVCGSRFMADNPLPISPLRKLGIWLLRTVVSALAHHLFTDTTSGFRAYNREAIRFLANSYPQDYPEPESLVELHRNRFRILEIPVQMRPRSGGRSSIGRLDSAYYMIKVILAATMAATRRRNISNTKDPL